MAAVPILTRARDLVIPGAKQCSDRLVTLGHGLMVYLKCIVQIFVRGSKQSKSECRRT